MAANINDKISNISSGVRPVSTTVSTIRNTGSTTLACADLTGWATDTAVHFVTYKIDGTGKLIIGSQADWKGIVSGTSINNLTITGGTDAGNAVGDIVEILPTARWGKELTDAIRVHSNQDGTLASNSVSTASIADGSVTGAKMETSVNPYTRMNESMGNFVASGCVWTATSGLNASMTAGVVYINGYRIVVSAIASQAFVASKDTYVSVDNTGAISIANAVANNAASPALPANSVWLAKVISGASAIMSITDLRTLGSGKFSAATQTDATNKLLTGISIQAGWGQILGNGTTSMTKAVIFPQPVTSVISIHINLIGYKSSAGAAATISDFNTSIGQTFSVSPYSISTTGFTAYFSGTSAFGAAYHGFSWTVIGV